MIFKIIAPFAIVSTVAIIIVLVRGPTSKKDVIEADYKKRLANIQKNSPRKILRGTPGNENAWLYYKNALDGLSVLSDDERGYIIDFLQSDFATEKPDLKRVSALFVKIDSAIKLARDGSRQLIYKPNIDFADPFSDPTPQLLLARYLGAYGKLCTLEGKRKEALEIYLDSIQISLDFQRRGSLINNLYGIVCIGINEKSLESLVIAISDPPLLKKLCSELDILLENTPPFLDFIYIESLIKEAIFLKYGRIACGKNEDSLTKILHGDIKYDTSGHSVMEYVSFCDGIMSLNGKNYKELEDSIVSLQLKYPLAKPFTAGIVSVLNANYVHFTRMKLLKLFALIQLYRVEKGSYPKQLDDLISAKYVTTLPNDPFDEKPLRYILVSQEQFKIYSVGSDLKDDRRTHESDDTRDIIFSNEKK